MLNIAINPTAFMKMQTLIMGYDKEVGWYGTMERTDDGLRVKDILVFPQYTSAAYIDDEREDPAEFANWKDTLSDEQYNSLRLWGHSHVNMGVSPSGVDKKMFDRFKEANERALDNRFTVAVIMNKKADMMWWAYDSDTNIEYKNKDINVMIEVEEGVSNLQFFEASKALVRDIWPTTHFLFNGQNSSYGGYSGYASGYNYGSYNDGVKEREKNSVNNPKKDTKKSESKKSDKKNDDIWDDCDDWDDYLDNFYDNYTLGKDTTDDIVDESFKNYTVSIIGKTVSVSETLKEAKVIDAMNKGYIFTSITSVDEENKPNFDNVAVCINDLIHDDNITYFEIIDEVTDEYIVYETLEEVINVMNDKVVDTSIYDFEDSGETYKAAIIFV